SRAMGAAHYASLTLAIAPYALSRALSATKPSPRIPHRHRNKAAVGQGRSGAQYCARFRLMVPSPLFAWWHTRTPMSRSGNTPLACLFLLIVSTALLGPPAAAQTPADMDNLLAAMDRLSLKVPMSVYARDPVKRFLGELARERCDQQAIADLGDALDKAGYRREAV